MGTPEALASIAADFRALDKANQLELLLEFAETLPELPDRLREAPELLERVEECQSPVYLIVECDRHDTVTIHATAPREAPTTRGFAAILVQGLSGLPAEAILGVPADFPLQLGITDTVSPLRIRGMIGMLARIQRQVGTLTG